MTGDARTPDGVGPGLSLPVMPPDITFSVSSLLAGPSCQ